eukprot:TRINITY_DN9629_c0_g1_i1.p1 TRINITY_DN9629_c0_g1~~TRINITY_DN9629_c0_g1_i1.p1  ORF type:complete len:483 (+),score=139.64 TRINITY_DN9629_c0_g1_i1:127-1575(+)
MEAKGPQPNSTYTFASQPRAVQAQRPKYRQPKEQDARAQPVNMMYDPRIVRGNTYRQPTVPAMQKPDPLEVQRQQELARRRAAKKRQQQKQRPRTPKAVDGRKHMDVQTELYLEELTDRVEETEIATQTDPFLDRPPSPLFIPPKTGVDVATQILDGELFDFDVEVKPLLEVLVGKTLEQSLMEVMEEEELDRLRDHQREFESLRAAELAEVQRMEEQAARREEEKQQRLLEQRQAVEQQKSTAEKIAARAFAHSYLSDLVPSVFNSLSEGGFFYDRQEREIESQFMPWLMGAVEDNLSATATSRLLLDDILRNLLARQSAAAAASPEPVAEAPAAEASATPGIIFEVTEPGETSTDGDAQPVDAVESGEGDNQNEDELPAPGDAASNPDDANGQADNTVADDDAEGADETNTMENGDTDSPVDATNVADEPEEEQDDVDNSAEQTVTATAETANDDTADGEEQAKREVEPREVTLAEETQA